MYGHRFISSLVVAGALLAPVSAYAAVVPQAKVVVKLPAVQLRVYDRSHKDYHAWDDQEDAAYRVYLTNNHMKYRTIGSLSARQQTNYWNYRHAQGAK